MLTDLEMATFHVRRYGRDSHQCVTHVQRAVRMYCAHCGRVGDCPHLLFDRCRCRAQIACSECLFETEGGMP